MKDKQSIFTRIGMSFSLGLPLFLFSEVMFWALPNKYFSVLEMQPWFLDSLLVWTLYSLIVYIMLGLIDHFNLKSFWEVFLAAAFYGWTVEGVIAFGKLFELFPLWISFTSLSWHALISVMGGFWFIEKAKVEKKSINIATFAVIMGLFWGLWAINWPLETEQPISLPSIGEFILFSFIITIFMVIGYFSFNSLNKGRFSMKKGEWTLIGGILVLFWLITILFVTILALLLPLLLVTLYIGFKKANNFDSENSILEEIQMKNNKWAFMGLFFMPLIASLTYALLLSLGLIFPSNIFVYLISTPLGLILLAVSLYKVIKGDI